MAHAYSIPSSSMSSPLFQYSSLLSLLSTRKQLFAVFIGSSILMFIILSTVILCFVDCQTRKSKQTRLEQKKKKKKNISMVSLNGLDHSCSTSLSNGKPLSISSPMSRETYYDNHQYKNLIPTIPVTPVVVLALSNSHSLSSIDSTTRANTAHNRTLTTNTCTYTALSTSEDFMPGEFDDQFQQMMDQNGVEYMMTTV
jgi:flagellar biosynthesis component FlhA